MQFFGTKIPTTKHEIMCLVAKGRIKDVDELRSRILTAGDELRISALLMPIAHASSCVLKRKADALNTNRA